MSAAQPRLVLVHGMMGSAANWGPFVHQLQSRPELRDWHILTPELLGHGRRGPDPRGLSLDLLADDLRQQVGQQPFVGLGHSLGARVLLRYASRHPGYLQALLCEDAVPRLEAKPVAYLREILEKTPQPFASRDAARDYFDARYGKSSPVSRFLQSNIRELSPGQHGWRFDAPGLLHVLREVTEQEASTWHEWAQLPVPLHVVLAERGHVSPALAAEARERRGNKSFSLAQIGQSGHWIHAEQLDAFVHEVARWLAQIGQNLKG